MKLVSQKKQHHESLAIAEELMPGGWSDGGGRYTDDAFYAIQATALRMLMVLPKAEVIELLRYVIDGVKGCFQ